jgi:hypothetical protein
MSEWSQSISTSTEGCRPSIVVDFKPVLSLHKVVDLAQVILQHYATSPRLTKAVTLYGYNCATLYEVALSVCTTPHSPGMTVPHMECISLRTNIELHPII